MSFLSNWLIVNFEYHKKVNKKILKKILKTSEMK